MATHLKSLQTAVEHHRQLTVSKPRARTKATRIHPTRKARLSDQMMGRRHTCRCQSAGFTAGLQHHGSYDRRSRYCGRRTRPIMSSRSDRSRQRPTLSECRHLHLRRSICQGTRPCDWTVMMRLLKHHATLPLGTITRVRSLRNRRGARVPRRLQPSALLLAVATPSCSPLQGHGRRAASSAQARTRSLKAEEETRRPRRHALRGPLGCRRRLRCRRHARRDGTLSTTFMATR